MKVLVDHEAVRQALVTLHSDWLQWSEQQRVANHRECVNATPAQFADACASRMFALLKHHAVAVVDEHGAVVAPPPRP